MVSHPSHEPVGKASQFRILRRHAVSLVELLVVLAIMAILVGLLLPAVQRVRAAAARTQCANQLKQVTMACHHFHDAHGRMPPAFGFLAGSDISGGNNALGNVFFHLLPFVERENLYRKARFTGPGAPGKPSLDYLLYTANGVHKTQVPLFNCPSDPTLMPGVNPKTNYAPSSYAGNYQVFGNVRADRSSRNAQGRPRLAASFPDGTSRTILFAEKYAAASHRRKVIDPAKPQGPPVVTGHVGGCHWAYFQADCHNPFFAFFERGSFPEKLAVDPNAIGPLNGADQRDGRFQIQPSPAKCNPCLPATGHSMMNAAMADGSVRALAADMTRQAWWALVTPVGGDGAEP